MKEGDLVIGCRNRGRSINQSRPFLPQADDRLPVKQEFRRHKSFFAETVAVKVQVLSPIAVAGI
jgi:hypothetical protein